MDLAAAASTLRANASDVQALLRALVDGLADALGERLQTSVTGGHFRQASALRSVRIAVGEERFEALVERSNLRCVIAHLSGGIRIRSETLATDEWINRLVAALASEAERSDSTRQALEHLVIGGNQ